MAYSRPGDLDGFAVHLRNPDTRFKLQLGQDLLTFLAEPANPITCQDIGQFVDALVSWMQNHFKVASLGIEVLTFLIDRLGRDFRPYLQTVLPAIIDRLGDSKDSVREKSQLLILKLLERNVLKPQTLFEKLTPGFTHKNAKIRKEVLHCLVNTLNEHGAHSLTLSKFIPDIVKLLSDPTSSVRDTAFSTLVDLYKHVGEKLRVDIQKRNLVPQAKWLVLAARFDEVRDSGELLPTASKNVDVNLNEFDKMSRPPQLTAPSIKRAASNTSKPKSAPVSSNAVSSGAGTLRKLTKSTASGLVDEDFFVRSFHEVPTMRIFSAKDVSDHLKSIQKTIGDKSKDWNKRQDALIRLRSLVIAGAANYEEFFVGLKNLDFALQVSLTDLRSQVVRETCITLAYFSQSIGPRFDRTAEIILQPLIMLIQNSVKVMATCGQITIKFLLKNKHSARLIPIIGNNVIKSKSKEIRRSCCEFVEIILTNWQTHSLEKHLDLLKDCVKKGVADADPEARMLSRRAFKGFKDHFPKQAEALLQSLDPSYRRALQGDGMSSGTVQSASDTGNRMRFRSNSAIDLQAAQRAQYSARPKRIPDAPVMASSERSGRTRSRKSQSQPTSRSGSPSSGLSYLYSRPTEHDSGRPRRRMSPGIPRSTEGSRDTSRETSPNRGAYISRFRRGNDRPPLSPAPRPVLAQKILQQSREAESALADAFNDSPETPFRSPRKTLRSIDNHSDESETSSICSERCYDLFKRPSEDINEIIALCASTTWQERREGLMSLQYYLSQDIKLTDGELKNLTELFAKMFTDSHMKGIGVFFDTLHEVITIHKEDLHYWLYVLLQRVFLKIGGETLHSIASKLINTLDLVRNCFSTDLLIGNVYRFLLDATQTPNAKSKAVVLNFLTTLYSHADAAGAVATSPNALQVLKKLIAFSQDAKSMDISQAAKVCIVAFWNCNIPEASRMFAELPKEQHDIASNIVNNCSGLPK